MVLLVTPLALGFVDIAYGSYAIAAVIVWFGLPRIRRIIHADSISILIALSALIVLVSPYWLGSPSPASRSAALGAALGVAYFLPVRWVVGHSVDRFVRLARVLVWFGIGLGITVLSNGVATQLDGTTATRSFVDFANANYVSAALAATASVTILLFLHRVDGVQRRWFYLIALILQALPLYQLGSRAALAGVVAAGAIALFLARAPRVARGTVFITLFAGYIAGWFPKEFAGLLTTASEPLTQFSSLGRGEAALLTASGRLSLWENTLLSIQQSPIVGWGPGSYGTYPNVTNIPAHAWGLEYVASVGIFGAMVITIAVWKSYWKTGRDGDLRVPHQGALWNATTAIALMPSLVLSTHQWNAWAWLTIALWACSHVLDDVQDVGSS